MAGTKITGAASAPPRRWSIRGARYAHHVARIRMAEQGFQRVSEATEPDGQIHLVLRRMG